MPHCFPKVKLEVLIKLEVLKFYLEMRKGLRGGTHAIVILGQGTIGGFFLQEGRVCEI